MPRVKQGSYDEYVTAIISELERELKKGKAILIVFADHTKLKRFSKEIRIRNPRIHGYKPPLELTDSLDDNERQSVITRAIRRYSVTLVTRPYGRGTDFVCRDQGLRDNGGVHLVCTFYPEHASEDKQVNGRVCRQDDPGSSRKILFDEDLMYLDASEKKKMQSGIEDWDEFLGQRRIHLEHETYQKMKQEHKQQLERHEKTLDASAKVCTLRCSFTGVHQGNRHLATPVLV